MVPLQNNAHLKARRCLFFFFGNFKFCMHTEFVYDVKLIILHKNNQHLIFELTRVCFMETTEPWCGLLKDTKHLGRI